MWFHGWCIYARRGSPFLFHRWLWEATRWRVSKLWSTSGCRAHHLEMDCWTISWWHVELLTEKFVRGLHSWHRVLNGFEFLTVLRGWMGDWSYSRWLLMGWSFKRSWAVNLKRLMTVSDPWWVWLVGWLIWRGFFYSLLSNRRMEVRSMRRVRGGWMGWRARARGMREPDKATEPVAGDLQSPDRREIPPQSVRVTQINIYILFMSATTNATTQDENLGW